MCGGISEDTMKKIRAGIEQTRAQTPDPERTPDPHHATKMKQLARITERAKAAEERGDMQAALDSYREAQLLLVGAPE